MAAFLFVDLFYLYHLENRNHGNVSRNHVAKTNLLFVSFKPFDIESDIWPFDLLIDWLIVRYERIIIR